MDESLFAKHFQSIKNQKNKKEEVINLIKNETGVGLSNEEIIISKNAVEIQTTSVKRSKLTQKNVKEALKRLKLNLK